MILKLLKWNHKEKQKKSKNVLHTCSQRSTFIKPQPTSPFDVGSSKTEAHCSKPCKGEPWSDVTAGDGVGFVPLGRDRAVAICFMKWLAFLWNSPSTERTNGVKVPLLSSTAFLYILFFSCELDSRMPLGARWQCDGASVSLTRTSKNASTCGCQTPLIPRSSLSPGSLEVAVASFTIGSFITWGYTWLTWSPMQSRISFLTV